MLANELIKYFKKRTKENPVFASDIVEGVNRVYKLKNKFSQVRLRKIINYYRTESILPVISTSKGYFVSYDEQDINDMMQSLCQRGNSIIQCSFGLGKILNKIKYKE